MTLSCGPPDVEVSPGEMPGDPLAREGLELHDADGAGGRDTILRHCDSAQRHGAYQPNVDADVGRDKAQRAHSSG